MKLLFVFLLFFTFTSAFFYLPGVAPRNYQAGDIVDLKVNKLTSVKTQVPYPYYSLPWCRPDEVTSAVENLGEILRGDKIQNSAFRILAQVPLTCEVLCQKEYTNKQIRKFASKIDEEYRHNWILDSLPGATSKTYVDENGATMEVVEEGFPIGYLDGKEYVFFNHFLLKIKYHDNGDNETIKIVGFEIQPKSFNYKSKNEKESSKMCHLESSMKQLTFTKKDKNLMITYSYSVEWVQSDIEWASRWDNYLKMTDVQIHWFSIINSLMIVLFLTGMVGMIMMRTIRADFRRYQELESEEAEETGWKLVHGDVFRSPQHPMLLSVFVGSGIQILAMFLITLIFAVLGFLSPSNRGSLMTAMVILFMLMGFPAGYTSANLSKTLKLNDWKRCTLMTALLLPGAVFSIFLVLNISLSSVGSSGAVPFQTLIALIALWFGVSTPLVYAGSNLGFQRPGLQYPVRVNQIPRQVPPQVWYMETIPSILMGGILPFGAVFIELFFILSSIWQQHFYYMFSFLFLVFIILILTCSEITIVLCYFHLCSENYHWWWRSYLTSGSSALYLFLYSTYYFWTQLEIVKFLSGLVYFGYTLIISLSFFVMTGTIGFISCFLFVRAIYGSVKID